MFRPLLLGVALMAAAPVVAQTQSPAGQDNDSARSNAIAAQTAQNVAAANDEVAAQARLQGGAAAAVNAANDARYTRDVARYRAAMRARRHTIVANEALQADRERAYAMAMADWRAQVRACNRGKTRACKMPSPNPQDYM